MGYSTSFKKMSESINYIRNNFSNEVEISNEFDIPFMKK